MQLAVFCTCYCYTFKLHTHMNLSLCIIYHVAIAHMISTLEKRCTFLVYFHFQFLLLFLFFFFFFVCLALVASTMCNRQASIFICFFFILFLLSSFFFLSFFCVNVGLTSGRPILSLSTATTRDLHTHHLLLNTHEPKCLRTLLF